MAEKPKRAASTPRAAKRKGARTAGGKRGSPEVLAEATMTAREGLRERTEAGHRAAGRTPPSEKEPARSAGAARIVDDSIRSWSGPVTERPQIRAEVAAMYHRACEQLGIAPASGEH